jgi:two-component system, response regulator FlrC
MLTGDRQAIAGALINLLENALQASSAGGIVELTVGGWAAHLPHSRSATAAPASRKPRANDCSSRSSPRVAKAAASAWPSSGKLRKRMAAGWNGRRRKAAAVSSACSCHLPDKDKWMPDMRPILVVEDDPALREALTDTLEMAGYRAIAASDAEHALTCLENSAPGLILTDVQMPGMDGHALLRALKARHPEIPVILMTAYGQINRAVQAMRDGAADYLPKPFEPDSLLATVARHFRQASDSTTEIDATAASLIAQDPASLALLELARRVAASDTSILLTGESGVGKEVYARYIHQHSHRAKAPFVALNCAAIPENLLESVLFGHEKGAFTGASTAQPGKFEQANGGILLLDEVSEMPLNLQAKLLRVLQEREVERVGGRTSLSARCTRHRRDQSRSGELGGGGPLPRRPVLPTQCFSTRNPAAARTAGRYSALAKHFLKRHEAVVGRSGFALTGAALAELTGYDWPGNIRELGNVVQRAMILAPGAEIGPEHLMLPRKTSAITKNHSSRAPIRSPDSPVESGLKDVERDTILNTLQRMQGSRRRTAEVLAMSERTLRHKLKQYREAGFLDGDDLL